MKKLIIGLAAVAFVAYSTPAAQAHDASPITDHGKKRSGVVPGMGEHWSHPKYPGAVFGVMGGKIVFIEYEVKNSDMVGSKNIDWDKLKMPGFMPRIDHTDIEYLPKGHRNMEIPHMAIHMYTVSHETHKKFKRKPRKK